MTDQNWPPPGESSGGPSSDYSPPGGQPVGGDVPSSWAPASGSMAAGAGSGGSAYPPPSYPQGYGLPPAAAPARRSNWWKWLLAVFVGLIVLGGGCSYLVFRAVRGPVDATNDFFAAVNDGDLSLAASLVSTDPSCSFASDPEGAIDQQFTGITVQSYFFAGATVNTGDGASAAEVIGLVTTLEEGDVSYTVDMLQEGDSWKVCTLERTG